MPKKGQFKNSQAYTIHRKSTPPGDRSYRGNAWDQAGIRAEYRWVFSDKDHALELARKLAPFIPEGVMVSERIPEDPGQKVAVQLAFRKRRKERALSKHLCATCGAKMKAHSPYITCPTCRREARQKQYQKRARAREAIAASELAQKPKESTQ